MDKDEQLLSEELENSIAAGRVVTLPVLDLPMKMNIGATGEIEMFFPALMGNQPGALRLLLTPNAASQLKTAFEALKLIPALIASEDKGPTFQ